MRKLDVCLCAASLWVICGTQSASAGWFGPSNYEECVLDKMRGEAAYMLPTAEAACREKFPAAPEPILPQLVQFDHQLIKYSEKKMPDNGDFAIYIEDKPRGYNIQSIKGVFVNRSPCDLNFDDVNGDDTSYGSAIFWSKKVGDQDLFRFPINGTQFICMFFVYYGTIQN
jgi:hypothetical protein